MTAFAAATILCADLNHHSILYVLIPQQIVKQKVEWVNGVCGARTTRAKKFCRSYGAEKMVEAMTKIIISHMRKHFTRWKAHTHYLADQV